MDAAEWDARYAQSELVWGAPPNGTVVEHVHGLERRITLQPDAPGEAPPPLPRALDLGCGEGRNAVWLATHGWQVRAVDFSQVAIDKGRTIASRLSRSVRGRIDWQCADVTDPAAAGLTGPFELILLVYLHLPPAPRRALLGHLADLLSPGGTLLVLGHDTTNITEGHGGPQDPSILFTPHDIRADLAAAGDHIRVRVADRVLRPTEVGDAIDALVVATRTVPDLEQQAVDAPA
ncbi:class I SAM-dependent methyltransferase [Nocardia wallacei]|uniref:class I SAM-dependent methyltransferase n=1 Tax=Nocardia wallacei TaxID=480035 RepID=UPI0024573978|nr:class I SAM-dependent methyltransferase [Nocardia wallacei]